MNLLASFAIRLKLAIHSGLLFTLTFSLASSPSAPFKTPNIPIEQLTCRPTGLIQDTTCNYETIDEVNRKLHSQLSFAVQLPIFRYHKVDLYRQCPFWSEDGLCGNQACAVNELDQEDVPAYWRTSELSDLRTTNSEQIPINLDDKCVVKEQDYCVLDDNNGVPSNGVYVDLLANPERFTGYSGKSAQRVWRAVYEENCFNLAELPQQISFGIPSPSPYAGLESKPGEDTRKDETCLEERVYYKLLSGLHTSISMHICDESLDPTTGKWAPNLQCYLNRIGLHPERLKNLYFAYTLMLRALSRSASYLNSPQVELCTGDGQVDSQTRKVLARLISTAHAYPVTFDETSMFKGGSSKQSNLKEEFKLHFRNVSRIMDCVGCDKCRLWGKLQVMGLGTALKLLFEYEDGDTQNTDFHLTRPELIAFINTLNRLSESLEAVEKFRKLWQRRADEGTLPVQVADEKTDAVASGLAAQAIALNPGLGPRVGSIWHGASSPTASPEKKDPAEHSPVKTVDVARPQQQEPTFGTKGLPSQTASPASLTSQLQSATSTGMVYHSQEPHPSRNRSDPTGERVGMKRQVVDLGIFIRPASRFFKLLSSRCVNSISTCAHWAGEFVAQIKILAHITGSGASAGHRLVHFQKQHQTKLTRSDREKEL